MAHFINIACSVVLRCIIIDFSFMHQKHIKNTKCHEDGFSRGMLTLASCHRTFINRRFFFTYMCCSRFNLIYEVLFVAHDAADTIKLLD